MKIILALIISIILVIMLKCKGLSNKKIAAIFFIFILIAITLVVGRLKIAKVI